MFVNRANPMLEAGVNISTLPVGVGVDSSLRMLAWGCRRSNPGGSRPSLHPPLFRAGGCALILYNFESKMQSVALSRYEKMYVLHVRKKLFHLHLGSQSDEYG